MYQELRLAGLTMPASVRSFIHTALSCALALPLLASSTAGDMPWNDSLGRLQANLTGPTATAILFIAIAAALGLWAISPDMRTLFKAIAAVVVLIIIAGLSNFTATMGITGAVL